MNQPTPSIAVIVPVHNKATHLNRSLNSILSQTCPPTEIIAVDDASTDNSREILRQIDDCRFQLIELDGPKGGPGFARNTGIRAATAEWIAFLDADDEWSPHFLATITEEIAGAGEDVTCIFTGYENDQGGRRSLHEFVVAYGQHGVRRFDLASYVAAWLNVGRSPIHTSSVVIRRKVLNDVGLFEVGPKARRGSDIALWLMCVSRGDAIFNPKICATYFRDAENMVTRMTSANVRPIICDTIRRLIPDRSPLERRLLQRLNNHLIFDYARVASRQGGFSARHLASVYPHREPRKLLLLLGLISTPPTARKLFSRLYSLRRQSA